MGKHILTTILAISIISLASICTVSADLNDTPVSPVELETIEDIQDAIDAEGGNWTAGTTSVSELTVDEKRQLCGARIGEVPEDAQLMRPPLRSGASCDPSFDWRNKDGKDWMTSVKNQGSCGSCWAFSALGIVEVAINIHFNDSDKDIDLSEQHLVSDCCSAGSCVGGWPGAALKYVKDEGVPEESCSPYASRDGACTPCTDWAENPWKVDYAGVSSTTDDFKYALQTYGPLSVVLSAPDDWFYYCGGVYEPAWSDENGVGWANHAVILVGWDDSEGCWIVKNSWGTGWGEQGYAKVQYGDLEKYNYAYAVTGIVSGNYENPIIHVEPATINVTMSAGDCSLENLTIRNYGDVQLTYTITDNASWLTPASMSGTVEPEPGALASVVVSFNATDLEAGNYTGEIRIESNDLNNATVIIPVALTVTINPALSMLPTIIAFTPLSPVSDIEGATRTFSITIDRSANVSWLINGNVGATDIGVTDANYTNTFASRGVWNVSAAVSDANGTVVQTWIWNVVPEVSGDVTCDGVVNIGDAVLLFNWVSFPNERGATYALSAPENADVTGDDKANIGDAVLLFNWVSFEGEQGTTYVLK